MPGNHERALEALARRGRLRALEAPHGIDFTSNDYLGLAQSQRTCGCHRSRASHAACRSAPAARDCCAATTANTRRWKHEAAQFFGAESALFFGGGFIANLALLSTLPQRGDLDRP